MINKTSNKTSTTKPSESKKKTKAPEWLFANIAEASKNARKIYFLFVGFLVYCGITVVGTTDRQIILNDAVSLPILKMDVPLNGFFILAPVIAIFVFIYLQLYLSIRKDLINDLKANYPQIGRERLYPWMLIILDYPKEGFVGRLQSAVVKLSVWCSAPLILMLISTWYVKKHDPILSYIIGLTPIFGTIIVSWFWFQYENIRFKIRKIPKLILNNLGKSFLIFTVILYQWIFLFFIIPEANDGFPYPYRQRGDVVEETLLSYLEPFFCVDLSYQILINKPAEEYKGIYWLDLKGAHLEGAVLTSTVLKQADLQEAHLQIAIIDNTNLQGANLLLANLKKAYLVQANLQGAHLSGANLEGANLEGADLRGANLYAADLRGADLRGANLSGATLERADLRGAKNLSVIMLNNARSWPLAFYDEDLLTKLGLPLDHNDRVSQRNFSEYNFMKTDLRGAILWGAYLMKADLTDAILTDAVLRGADLSGANLNGANLSGAILNGANLSGANLSGAIDLTIEQLSQVKTLYKAELDPKLMEQIKEKYPHLLEKPVWLKEEKVKY